MEDIMKVSKEVNYKIDKIYNDDYELQIVYSRSCNLNFQGKEIGQAEYHIEMYDIDMNRSVIGPFESFEDMRTCLNKENLFDCLDNDPIISLYSMDNLEIGDEIEVFRFTRVLFNDELIIRQD